MKKKSIFTDEANLQYITWKATSILRHYMTRFGDIKPRKFTGHSVKIQKKVRKAILRAREIGLTPLTK